MEQLDSVLVGGINDTTKKMKLRLIYILSLLLISWLLNPAIVSGEQKVIVLTYHDVGKVSGQWTITRENLAAQFEYLKQNGYHPISLKQYIESNTKQASLPDKPVLISFDDGYISFYNDVFPLLKQYQFPAMLAIVTSWETAAKPPDTGQLVNWQQLREMEASGLVTIASHSHDLHHYIAANPNDRGPAPATLLFANGRYETTEEYQKRIAADMDMTQKIFEKELGHQVIAYVWPYGAYTQTAVAIGKSFGFQVFFTLLDGFDLRGVDPLERVRRTVVDGRVNQAEYARLLATADVDVRPLRIGQLDLDFLYDTDRKQFEANIDAAIDYLTRSRVNTVFLEAHADDSGTGNIDSVYFYTRSAPMKADVFGYLVQRLHQADFRVYAWLSTLSGQWLLKNHPEDEVLAMAPDKKGWYRRATPFSPRVREALKSLVGDLAAYSAIDGVIFNDDLYFNDFEDLSPAAKAVFKDRFGRDLTAEALKDPEIMRAWTDIKTKALNELTLEMIAQLRKYRPDAASARNIYAPVILEDDAKEWFAEDYHDYLKLYDYTVVMAYPRMEKVKNPEVWLKTLVRTALADPVAADKVIFKLQAFDWSTGKWLHQKELSGYLRALKSSGAVHIAYYPVNALEGMEDTLPF